MTRRSETTEFGLSLALDHARSVLLRMSERRFGPLPSAARERVLAADLDAVLAWTENVPFADTLDDVFDAPGA